MQAITSLRRLTTHSLRCRNIPACASSQQVGVDIDVSIPAVARTYLHRLKRGQLHVKLYYQIYHASRSARIDATDARTGLTSTCNELCRTGITSRRPIATRSPQVTDDTIVTVRTHVVICLPCTIALSKNHREQIIIA